MKLSGIGIDGNEKEFDLKDFAGERIVLYFYQKIILRDVRRKHVILEIISIA